MANSPLQEHLPPSSLAADANALPINRTDDLRSANEELRRLVEQLKGRLQQADANAEARWKAKELEYESLIEEKSEVIRQLYSQMQELQTPHEPAAVPPPGEGPSEEELIALHQELEREREQLKEDEEALMAQMRDMEVQMSKERADLARQRGELQRLHTELKRELEIASRDAVLREKLAPLYRLQDEILSRRSGESASRPKAPPPTAGSAPAPPAIRKAPETKAVRRSGFFRRLFTREE